MATESKRATRPRRKPSRPAAPAEASLEVATEATPSAALFPAEAHDLAATLLRPLIAAHRAARGGGDDPFASVRIADEEADAFVAGPDRGRRATVKKSGADDIARARAAFAGALSEPSLLSSVAWCCGLGIEETEVLATLIAVELEPELHRMVSYVQDSIGQPRLTLATLRRMFPPPHPGVLAIGAESRLRRAAQVEIDDTGPWGSRRVSVPAPVIWAFVGDRSLDPDLPPAIRFLPTNGTEPAPLLLVTGADRESRAQRAASLLPGTAAIVCACPQSQAEWSALIRESTLGAGSVVVEVENELPQEARQRIEQADHLAWALSSADELPIDELPDLMWTEVRVEDGRAAPQEWLGALGVAQPTYPLDRHQLRMVARSGYGRRGEISAAVRRLAGGHLDRYTTRIRPDRGWDDVVLPAEQLGMVRDLVARYRHRPTVYGEWSFTPRPSIGITGMFAGPSGTGKTLTAEVIAGELGLDLFKLDLSSVVSKYIGETEKNLDQIFNAAAAGEAVIFFDEADALFGKRSEVTSAHDRYANIEVSYLLQRLETYDGMVLLATNLASNIDQAFLRRIHVTIDFAEPDEPERLQIWEKSFAPDCPTDQLDLPWLAREFKLTGGSIHNVALAAAFLAADRGSPVTMPFVVTALRREFKKVGRLLNESELTKYSSTADTTRRPAAKPTAKPTAKPRVSRGSAVRRR